MRFNTQKDAGRAVAELVASAKVVLRLGVALLRRAAKPGDSLNPVLRHTPGS